MKYVLDTNTLIYLFKGMGDVRQQLLKHSPKEIGIPAIVLFELETGLARSTSPEKRLQQLSNLLEITTVLPFGAAEARIGGQIRAELEQAGEPIGPYDILIAATALAQRSILVTRNTKEFSRIAGLSLENWYNDARG